MNAVYIIGTFLAFFLMVLLLTKPHKSLSDKILALWMFFIGLHIFGYYLSSAGYWEKYPHLVGTHHPFPLLHGPMLYLYTLYSLRPGMKWRKKDLLHFLPFLISYLYMSPFLFTYTEEQKRLSDQAEMDPSFRVYFVVSLIILIISGILYPVLSYLLIKKHRRRIGDQFAWKEKLNFKWLQLFITGIFSVYAVVALFTLLRFGLNIQPGFDPAHVFFALIVGFVLVLGYFGIKQQDIFINPVGVEVTELPKSKPGYQNSGLKEEEAKMIHSRLKGWMEEEKPYLEPKLSLGELSQQLGVSANYLSQVINQYEGKNFYDFVNAYRVNEFIATASQPDNKKYNLLALAFEAGFNSKSSFNQIFKKQTGKTPTEFLRETN